MSVQEILQLLRVQNKDLSSVYFTFQEVNHLTQLEGSTLNFDLAQGYALNALAGTWALYLISNSHLFERVYCIAILLEC